MTVSYFESLAQTSTEGGNHWHRQKKGLQKDYKVIPCPECMFGDKFSLSNSLKNFALIKGF